ncbi:MAG: cytidylate kinase-like family protein [Polyangia bacterium]|jgi:cytidylate kinase
MTSDESLESLKRFMEARLYEWRQSERKRLSQPGPVITISREPGCRGESIAQKVAAALDFHLYTWEIVEQIAKDEHVSVQVVATLDEKTRSELENWLAEFGGTHNLSTDAYLEDLKKVIFAIASHGRAIILGRGANFLLPPEKRIGLYFVAPLALRIRNVMEDRGLSEKRAREHIAKVEKEHRQLVKKNFQADIRDSAHYHLVINTALVKPETIAGIVKEVIGRKS